VTFYVVLRGWPFAQIGSRAAVKAIGAGVILHVAIGQRWPFAPSIETETTHDRPS
jgi:hypothetical protein